jgi:cytochrome P450
MARAFWPIRGDPLRFLVDVHERYGDLLASPVPGAPVLLANDPSDVRRVPQLSVRSWGKQTAQYAALARVTGPGLLASSDPSWIEHRRLAAPAFQYQRLEAVSDCIGRDFALGEAVVVLSRLLRDHQVRLPDRWSRPPADAQVAVQPRGGMHLLLERVPRRPV